MVSFFAKIFIKDYKNYSDVKVREKYGVLCGIIGIILNILLFTAKLVAGLISASVAMVADAFNNLSDAASSVIQILGFKIASMKPDVKHPMGHGRVEYITGLIISFFVIFMGIELFRTSIRSIIHPELIVADSTSIIILVVAIAVKFYMMAYNRHYGKKIKSVAMNATATDSFCDGLSTTLVLISIILSQFTSLPVDGIAGIIVSGFIIFGGIEAAKETVGPLLGSAPSKEFVKSIEEELLKHKPIIGMHDLIVHDYGPGRFMISLHAEVPGDLNVFETHDVIDLAEHDISKKFCCQTVIHMDPIDLHNKQLSYFKGILNTELKNLNPELKAHDVRMVPGVTHTNLIFDVVKTIGYKGEDKELCDIITKALKQYPEFENVNCVITVDQPFV